MSTEPRDDDHPAADHQLFEREVACCRPWLFPTALRLTGNPDDAEDLIQETMARAYAGLGHYTPGTNARAWLLRIMTNCSRNAYRKRRREPVQFPSADLEAPSVTTAMTGTPGTARRTPSAEEEVLSQLAYSECAEALAELPRCFQATIYLTDVEGYSCREVADILDISIGTVMSRLHRARLRIRTRFSASSR
ncbi:MAG TPA: sigma-70 family RNA polymerase sigma factor [Streptosporangiaceae bacterium]|nr:sigma-70 family RNA polymerase sigma factor [Streptosporangiaceae bacterium]